MIIVREVAFGKRLAGIFLYGSRGSFMSTVPRSASLTLQQATYSAFLVMSVRRRVIKETTIRVRNESGMVTMPGWLKGMI